MIAVSFYFRTLGDKLLMVESLHTVQLRGERHLTWPSLLRRTGGCAHEIGSIVSWAECQVFWTLVVTGLHLSRDVQARVDGVLVVLF